MSFDPVAFAMGKDGISRGNVISSLMGGGSGGGGTTTLEESGWIKALGASAEVSGNVVTLKAASGHTIDIAPPESVRATKRFEPGDTVEISLTVTKNYRRFSGFSDQNKSSTVVSATDYMVPSGNSAMTGTWGPLGSDTLTFSVVSNSNYIRFNPVGNDGATSSSAYATFEVTGLRFNGVIVFGTIG